VQSVEERLNFITLISILLGPSRMDPLWVLFRAGPLACDNLKYYYDWLLIKSFQISKTLPYLVTSQILPLFGDETKK
jgi:hypothetical protein